MRRKLLTLILTLAAALFVACGGSSGAGEPAAAPAESQPESQADVTGAAGDTGDAQTGESAAGQPKFIEFYADW